MQYWFFAINQHPCSSSGLQVVDLYHAAFYELRIFALFWTRQSPSPPEDEPASHFFELLQMSICEISFRPLLGLPYCPGFLTLENQVEDPLEDFFREACDRGRWICHLCCFRCYTPLHLCSFLRLLTFPRFRLMEAVADGIERRKNIESMLMDNLCW